MITFNFIAKEDIYSIIPFLHLLHKNIPEEILKERLDEMIEFNYKCIGIFDEKRLIGICGIWILVKYYVGKHIEADNVIILPEYRNKKIGKDLIKYIEEYAKDIGCIASELNCYIQNEEGKRFWEQEGYKAIGYHFQKNFNAD